MDTNPSFRRTSGLRFRVLLAGDAEARQEYVAGDPYTGSLIVIKFRNYIQPEPRFRALLTEGDARTLFYRKEFDWLGEESV